MKRAELSRELKELLWKLFDSGQTFEGVKNVSINGERVPDEAVDKQRRLWREYRTRNPKPIPNTKHALQETHTAAGAEAGPVR